MKAYVILVILFLSACSSENSPNTLDPDPQRPLPPVNTKSSSLYFGYNGPEAHDYALQTEIPAGFGLGEFTLEMWLKLDTQFPVGPATKGATNANGDYLQLVHWYDGNPQIYTSTWWYRGNFLLDGHNNNGGFDQGTFSVQFYNGGCVRWMLGDGDVPRSGGVWGAQAPPDANCSLLDGAWHHLAFVRRFVDGVSELQIWVDGVLINPYNPLAPEVSGTVRTEIQADLYSQYWRSWTSFSAQERGWFWGAEKQAAIGTQALPGYGLPYYEDYKGLIDEVRFWNIAKTFEPNTYKTRLTGRETGLLAWFDFSRVEDNRVCDVLSQGTAKEVCWQLYRARTDVVSSENAPLE